MLELAITILREFIKINIAFCKFLYPILIIAGIILGVIEDPYPKTGDRLLFLGVLFFIISEIIAPILGIC